MTKLIVAFRNFANAPDKKLGSKQVLAGWEEKHIWTYNRVTGHSRSTSIPACKLRRARVCEIPDTSSPSDSVKL